MNRLQLFACLSAIMVTACAAPLDPVPPIDDSFTPPTTPPSDETLFAAPIVQVTADEAASFVLLADGSVWGFTTVPQPALAPEKRSTFYGVQGQTPIRMEGLDNVASLAFRYRHGCALHRNGTVSCWGDNRYGQLGIGTRTSTSTPTRIEGLDHVVQVDVGEEHTCALVEGGKVFCWGQRAAYFPHNPLKGGQILDKTPFELAGFSPMKKLALSRLHTCATTTDGKVQCWGNLWPDDSSTDITLAEQIKYRDFRLTETPADLLHGSCVLGSDGSVACACQNEESSIAVDKLPCYLEDEPISTFGTGIVFADSQMSQLCAVFEDGALRCKGAFRSAFNDVEPWKFLDWERIEGLSAPSAISVGVDTCVIDDQCVKCFGPWIGRTPLTIGCHIPPPDPPK